MKHVFLGLGSNVGNRSKNLQDAIFQLTKYREIILVRESSIYETKPFGYIDQADFLNMAVEIETSLTPMKLLEIIHVIEENLGRTREIHWGPRTIDIDILLFGDMIISNKDLQIPHPYLAERLFVLMPLLEIYSGGIPGNSLSLNQIINRLSHSKGDVKVWEK